MNEEGEGRGGGMAGWMGLRAGRFAGCPPAPHDQRGPPRHPLPLPPFLASGGPQFPTTSQPAPATALPGLAVGGPKVMPAPWDYARPSPSPPHPRFVAPPLLPPAAPLPPPSASPGPGDTTAAARTTRAATLVGGRRGGSSESRSESPWPLARSPSGSPAAPPPSLPQIHAYPHAHAPPPPLHA